MGTRTSFALLVLLATACGSAPADPDGAPDAAAVGSDAGAPDGGAHDLGTDAEPADTGAADARALDAGPLDAGASDARALDAGALDAGETDAGQGACFTRPDASIAGEVGGWVRSPANPLIRAGFSRSDGRVPLSAADPTVLYDEAERRWKMWFSSGLQGPQGVDVDILYAESEDGTRWTIQDAPAFEVATATSAWDHTHVETPNVIEVPGAPPELRFLLYYSGGNMVARPGPFPWYQVGLAFSSDGRHFTRLPAAASPHGQEGLVLDWSDTFAASTFRAADGVVADPSALFVNGRFEIWVSSYAIDGAGSPLAFGLSHLSAADGVHWTAEANPIASLAPGGAQPSVLYDASLQRYELWFTRDDPADTRRLGIVDFGAYGFRHATSPDGVAWTEEAGYDFAWSPARDYESFGLLTGVAAMRRAGTTYLFYSAWDGVSAPPGFYGRHDDACFLPAVITLDVATR